jgi:hypothetical protein
MVMACFEKHYPKIIPFFTCRVEFWKITKDVNWGSNYQETGSRSSEKFRKWKDDICGERACPGSSDTVPDVQHQKAA